MFFTSKAYRMSQTLL